MTIAVTMTIAVAMTITADGRGFLTDPPEPYLPLPFCARLCRSFRSVRKHSGLFSLVLGLFFPCLHENVQKNAVCGLWLEGASTRVPGKECP